MDGLEKAGLDGWFREGGVGWEKKNEKSEWNEDERRMKKKDFQEECV